MVLAQSGMQIVWYCWLMVSRTGVGDGTVR